MIKLEIQGMAEVQRQLSDLGRQMPFAASRGLNLIGERIKAQQIHEMRDIFDRPTPYTLSALRLKPATKSRLVAEVAFKNEATKAIAADKFLAAQVAGGERRMKRFERALQAVGALPAGYRAVPGSAAEIDAYGNMKPSQIVQILAWFRAFPETGYRANMTDKGRSRLAKGSKKKGTLGHAYFAGKIKGQEGIWKRIRFSSGSAVKPVLIFVRSTRYEAIYDFDYVAKLTFEREGEALMRQAIAEAIRTAR